MDDPQCPLRQHHQAAIDTAPLKPGWRGDGRVCKMLAEFHPYNPWGKLDEWRVLVISELGRQRWPDPWGSQSGQPSLMSEPQIIRRLLRNTKS